MISAGLVDALDGQPSRRGGWPGLVGDELHRQAQALAEVGADPDGVLDGVVERRRPPDVAVGVRGEGLGAQAGQGAVEFAAALGVVAFADELQVDGEVAALGPAFLLGDECPAAGEDERELRCVDRDEQR